MKVVHRLYYKESSLLLNDKELLIIYSIEQSLLFILLIKYFISLEVEGFFY